MRSMREIQERLARTNDAFVIETLRWVLEGDCPICDNKKRREFEIAIHTDEYGPEYFRGLNIIGQKVLVNESTWIITLNYDIARSNPCRSRREGNLLTH